MIQTITTDQARRYLLGHLHLNQFTFEASTDGFGQFLKAMRCIQLDPLNRIGTNPDLVAHARIKDYRHGDLFKTLFPNRAFEFFAKERCLLPTEAFPHYRVRARHPFKRLSPYLKKIPEAILADVLAEVKARGPLALDEFDDRGKTAAKNLGAWKVSQNTNYRALEVLWTRCQVVVIGRRGRHKIYDLPERVFGVQREPEESYDRWALKQRIEAAGLLACNSGPFWSMLEEVRGGAVIEAMVKEGQICEIQIEGANRRYLAPADFLERSFPEPDEHMRLIAPLDPLMWDRKLVAHVFDFDYVWEVYKPAKRRIWGYYVCPLLYQGRLVGRLEGRVEKDQLVVERLWMEEGERLNKRKLMTEMQRLALANGVTEAVLKPDAF